MCGSAIFDNTHRRKSIEIAIMFLIYYPFKASEFLIIITKSFLSLKMFLIRRLHVIVDEKRILSSRTERNN